MIDGVVCSCAVLDAELSRMSGVSGGGFFLGGKVGRMLWRASAFWVWAWVRSFRKSDKACSILLVNLLLQYRDLRVLDSPIEMLVHCSFVCLGAWLDLSIICTWHLRHGMNEPFDSARDCVRERQVITVILT